MGRLKISAARKIPAGGGWGLLLHRDRFRRTGFFTSGAAVTIARLHQRSDIFRIKLEALIRTLIHADAASGAFLGIDLGSFSQSNSPPSSSLGV